MIIISSRKNFSDPDKDNNKHTVKEVNLNNDTVIQDFETDDAFINAIAGTRICLLVHGYNNEFFEVCDSYQLIEAKIEATRIPYNSILGYMWPGGDHGWEWWAAKSRANGTSRLLRQFLEKLKNNNVTVDIISHSLGARVVLKALKDANTSLVRNYYCMAGAVDNESLEINEEFSAALNNLEKIFVMHSARDEVLSLAYRTAEMDSPLGLYGPEDVNFAMTSVNIWIANCKQVVANHGGYKRSSQVFSYILQTQQTPPGRLVTL